MKQTFLSPISMSLLSLVVSLGACSDNKPKGSTKLASTEQAALDDSAGPDSDAISAEANLIKVTNLLATVKGKDINVNWTIQPDATSYTVSWQVEGQAELGSETVTPATFSIKNLGPGNYLISVKANAGDLAGPIETVKAAIVEVAAPAPTAPVVVSFTLKSSAFQNNQPIPAQFVVKGGGGNMSPPLQWVAAPAGTGSFAIQVVDLDAGTPPLIHWMISNIPVASTQIPAGIAGGNNLAQPPEAMGANQRVNYRGPNPPALHRYEFTVYAIKQGMTLTLTNNNSTTNKTELETKSLGRSVLIGTYQ